MVREVLSSIDSELPLYDIAPLSTFTDSYVAPQRLSAILLSVFAGLALLLAAVGAYSVMDYLVADRTQEIGIRRALGASPMDVLRMVMQQGVWLALAGVGVGILVPLSLGHIVTPMLFGVKASDPMTFAVVGGLLMAVTLVACHVPARRSICLEPIDAVRHE